MTEEEKQKTKELLEKAKALSRNNNLKNYASAVSLEKFFEKNGTLSSKQVNFLKDLARG